MLVILPKVMEKGACTNPKSKTIYVAKKHPKICPVNLLPFFFCHFCGEFKSRDKKL